MTRYWNLGKTRETQLENAQVTIEVDAVIEIDAKAVIEVKIEKEAVIKLEAMTWTEAD
jgi:hypothetical protein